MSEGTPSKEQLKEIFDYFDKDGSGKIDVSELKAAITEYYNKCVGRKPTDKEVDDGVEDILRLSDSSKDGHIDEKEWFKYFESQ